MSDIKPSPTKTDSSVRVDVHHIDTVGVIMLGIVCIFLVILALEGLRTIREMQRQYEAKG